MTAEGAAEVARLAAEERRVMAVRAAAEVAVEETAVLAEAAEKTVEVVKVGLRSRQSWATSCRVRDLQRRPLPAARSSTQRHRTLRRGAAPSRRLRSHWQSSSRALPGSRVSSNASAHTRAP